MAHNIAMITSNNEPTYIGSMMSTELTKQSLHEQISTQVRRLYGQIEPFAWLAAPQPLMELRIPARMIATGEGLAVLDILRRAQADE
jgi:hypothetical protein